MTERAPSQEPEQGLAAQSTSHVFTRRALPGRKSESFPFSPLRPVCVCEIIAALEDVIIKIHRHCTSIIIMLPPFASWFEKGASISCVQVAELLEGPIEEPQMKARWANAKKLMFTREVRASGLRSGIVLKDEGPFGRARGS